jgi:hypothetical protein
MPLFKKGRFEILRRRLRSLFKKPGLKDKEANLGLRQRTELSREAFPKKFGRSISKKEYERAVGELRKIQKSEPDFQKKREIARKIRFLNKLEKSADLPEDIKERALQAKQTQQIRLKKEADITKTKEASRLEVLQKEKPEPVSEELREETFKPEVLKSEPDKVPEVQLPRAAKETEKPVSAKIPETKTEVSEKKPETILSQKPGEEKIPSEIRTESIKEKTFVRENPEITAIKSKLSRIYESGTRIVKQPERDEEEEDPLFEKSEVLKRTEDIHYEKRKHKKIKSGPAGELQGKPGILKTNQDLEYGTKPIRRLGGLGKTEEPAPLFEKPGILKNDTRERLGLGQKEKTVEQINPQDTSIFGGKEELTRRELRNKLRYDPKVWKAGVETKFNLSADLSRAGREKLEKELFSKVYGTNISKSDVQRRVKRMIIERGGTGDAAKKETLRREINFLKKLGGIK